MAHVLKRGCTIVDLFDWLHNSALRSASDEKFAKWCWPDSSDGYSIRSNIICSKSRTCTSMFLTLIYTERITDRPILMLFLFGKYDYQSMLVFVVSVASWILYHCARRSQTFVHKTAAETAASTTATKSSHSILCLGGTASASAWGSTGSKHVDAAELGGGKLYRGMAISDPVAMREN